MPSKPAKVKNISPGQGEDIFLDALKRGTRGVEEIRSLFKNSSTYYYNKKKLIDNGRIYYVSTKDRQGKPSGEFHLVNKKKVIDKNGLKLYLGKLSDENKLVQKQASSDIQAMCENNLFEASLLKLIVNSLLKNSDYNPHLLRLLCRQYTLWQKLAEKNQDENPESILVRKIIPKNVKQVMFTSKMVGNAWNIASDVSSNPGHRNIAIKYLRFAKSMGQFTGKKNVYKLAFDVAKEENDAFEFMAQARDAIVDGVIDDNEYRLQMYKLLDSGDARVKKRGKYLLDMTASIIGADGTQESVEKPQAPVLKLQIGSELPAPKREIVKPARGATKAPSYQLDSKQSSEFLDTFKQIFEGNNITVQSDGGKAKNGGTDTGVKTDNVIINANNVTIPEPRLSPSPGPSPTRKISEQPQTRAASSEKVAAESVVIDDESNIAISTVNTLNTESGIEPDEFTTNIIHAGDTVNEDDFLSDEALDVVEERIYGLETVETEAGSLEPISIEPPDGYELIDKYWINPPHCCVNIMRRLESLENKYFLVEPELDEFAEDLLSKLSEHLRDVLARGRLKANEDRSEILDANMEKLLHIYGIDVDKTMLDKLRYYLHRDFIGYGRIDGFMHDQNIEDISCDGVEIPIFLYLRKYQNIMTNLILGEEELDSMVVKLTQKCGKHISIGSPVTQATLPDGSRLEATFGREVTTRGSSFTIRRFRHEPFTPVDLVNSGTYSPEMLAYLWLGIENNLNFIVSGGTASGKTSTLNALSIFIPPSSKIVSIEDTRELTLYHQNWVAKVTRDSIMGSSKSEINMYDLLRAALRERPEYILVGEVRGREAQVLFQAMNTGHTTYSTMHAGSVQAVVNRLLNEPINVPMMMFQSLNVILVQALIFDAGRKIRRCIQIVEITSVDQRTGNLSINEVFGWSPSSNIYEEKSNSFALSKIQQNKGWSTGELNTEVSNRVKVIKYLIKNEINRYSDVAPIIESYYRNPQFVLSMIESGELKAS